MFDFDKEEQETAETFAPCLVEGEWERITDTHAAQAENAVEAETQAAAHESPEAVKERIYRKIYARRRDRTAVTAAHYGLLAVGSAAVAWIARDFTGLAVTLGIVALVLALTAAYGAGKYHEM